MPLLITGSRNLTDKHRDAIFSVLDKAVRDYVDEHGEDADNTLIHGAARGADSIGASWATERGWKVESYPANWEEYGKSADYIRNEQMVRSGVDLCVAFPMGNSYGTRNCMKIARQHKVPVVAHEFDDPSEQTLFSA